MIADKMHETNVQEAVYSVVAAPGFCENALCFAATSGGVYRSDDGGRIWRWSFEALNLDAPLPATSIALSPAFLRDRTIFAGVPGGVLRSIDGGREWTKSVFPLPAPFISALALSPAFEDDGVVFAATVEDGVFRSVDRGSHWDAWNIGLFDPHVLSLAVSPDYRSDRTVYAGTESGIYCSQNGGRFWRALPFPSDEAVVLSLALSPAFAQDGEIFAGVEAGGLAYSRDRGQSWEWLGERDIDGPINAIVLSPDFPRKPELLVMLDDALLVSHDRGATWARWTESLNLPSSASAMAAPLGLDADAVVLLGLADGGVLRLP